MFYSHVQRPSLSSMMRSMKLGWLLHKSSLPPEDACFIWIDYLTLRQCVADFLPQAINALIRDIGCSLIELDQDFDYASRTFCIFEAWASIDSGAKVLCITFPQHKRLLDGSPIDASAAQCRFPSDKALIDALVEASCGFAAVDSMVTEELLSAHRRQYAALYDGVAGRDGVICGRHHFDSAVVLELKRLFVEDVSKLEQSRLIKRIHAEIVGTDRPYRSFGADFGKWFDVRHIGGNPFHWRVAITAQQPPYEGGTFFLDVFYPEDYPFVPMKVEMITKICHPNIAESGAISVDFLEDQWFPALTIEFVVVCLAAILVDPNPDDAFAKDVAELYRSDPAEFARKAREWTSKYAM